MSRKAGCLLAVYSVGHFAVDLASAFLMLSLIIPGGRGIYAFLLYNFCAFALQMPAGLIADKLNKNALVAVSGLVLILSAFALYKLPLTCSAVLGIGNCLYHIGGGVDVLHMSDKREWMLGVFVSPGAVGLFVGSLLAERRSIPMHAGACVILICFILIAVCIHLTAGIFKASKNPPPDIRPRAKSPALAYIALFAVVVLRSYVGMTLSFPWRKGTLASVAVLGLALGKAAGGFLADRFGARRVAVATLALSSVMFLFSGNAICGIAAIFLFNMTMPLTLFALAEMLPNARGFAFGILTFALFIGYLPEVFGVPVPFRGEGLCYAIMALISLLLLFTGLTAAGRKDAGNDGNI